jgi:hypothetical protein
VPGDIPPDWKKPLRLSGAPGVPSKTDEDWIPLPKLLEWKGNVDIGPNLSLPRLGEGRGGE